MNIIPLVIFELPCNFAKASGLRAMFRLSPRWGSNKSSIVASFAVYIANMPTGRVDPLAAADEAFGPNDPRTDEDNKAA